jgi:hypothetical protein
MRTSLFIHSDVSDWKLEVDDSYKRAENLFFPSANRVGRVTCKKCLYFYYFILLLYITPCGKKGEFFNPPSFATRLETSNIYNEFMLQIFIGIFTEKIYIDKRASDSCNVHAVFEVTHCDYNFTILFSRTFRGSHAFVTDSSWIRLRR